MNIRNHIDKVLSGLTALAIGALLTVILFSTDKELIFLKDSILTVIVGG